MIVCREWLDPEDPRWVGAWWLGFVFAALAMFLFAIPMSGFPRDLPGTPPPLPSLPLDSSYDVTYVQVRTKCDSGNSRKRSDRSSTKTNLLLLRMKTSMSQISFPI